MTTLDKYEYESILDSLINYHSIFYKFWKLCRPRFSDEIDTACVSFNKDYDCIDFLINKDFWNSQSDHNKKFIISHECWHVINFHSKRVNNKLTAIANAAMDIVVNESLVKYFGFNRKEIDPDNNFCWLDTCFTKEDNVEPWHNFEYYLNKLKDKQSGVEKLLVTSHDGLSSITEEVLSEILEGMSDEEIEVIKNITQESEKNSKKESGGQQAGTGAGNLTKEFLGGFGKKKKKWESVIRKFQKKIKIAEVEDTHWLYKNRRVSNLKSNLFIPSEVEDSMRKSSSEKISTWFFMDTSGSCWGLADRFFKAASSLDPNIFDVKYFYFDTKVYPANLKTKLVLGGGGTSFKCISNFVYAKNNSANPYVWILTDGFGDELSIPSGQLKKWHWFLTENGCKTYISPKSKTYDLQNFE
jgi:hypothetical protein